MTDKEWPDEIWAWRHVRNGDGVELIGWDESPDYDDSVNYVRGDLILATATAARAHIASQAAEIELLKRVAREVALQHHNWNQHNASLIGEQAAEIERMRAHIQAGRELVPRFQFLFPTSGSKESVGTMVDVLAHMRAQAFLGSAPASGH